MKISLSLLAQAFLAAGAAAAANTAELKNGADVTVHINTPPQGGLPVQRFAKTTREEWNRIIQGPSEAKLGGKGIKRQHYNLSATLRTR